MRTLPPCAAPQTSMLAVLARIAMTSTSPPRSSADVDLAGDLDVPDLLTSATLPS